ncbi:MAG: hypothetical protein ACYDAG_12725 [Chloroflexota bacterium]
MLTDSSSPSFGRHLARWSIGQRQTIYTYPSPMCELTGMDASKA